MRATTQDKRLIHKATGGSSGVPLQFDLNPDSNDRRMAAWHRGYSWAGAEPGTKQFYFWGGAVGNQPRWKRWKDAAYSKLYRRKAVSCFSYRDDLAKAIAEQLAAYRPNVIVAYTNPLYSWARALKDQGLRPFSPQSIVVGAEKLHDFQRELIESVFQCRVFETYGSREFMLIGAECDRHDGLHVTMEHLLVEVLDDNGLPTPDGEEGNLVITDLFNYGMPFIRYMNGDRAIAGLETCSCGRGLPSLRKVVGRRLDMLTTLDGRQIPGEFFPHLLKDYFGIDRFQVVQDSPDAITLRLVANCKWSGEDLDSIKRQVRAVAGADVRFDVNLVDDIPLSPAGKLQVVVNAVRYGNNGVISAALSGDRLK
jgi:phenylacetate-CoA ligase